MRLRSHPPIIYYFYILYYFIGWERWHAFHSLYIYYYIIKFWTNLLFVSYFDMVQNYNIIYKYKGIGN